MKHSNPRVTLEVLQATAERDELRAALVNVPPPTPVVENLDHPDVDEWLRQETDDQTRLAVDKMLEVISLIDKAREEYTGTLISESPFMEGLLAGIIALYDGPVPRMDHPRDLDVIVRGMNCLHRIRIARAKIAATKTYSRVTKEMDSYGKSGGD